MQTADSTAACTGNGSNHADMLYLMDPADYHNKSNLTYDDILFELAGTMAHELQHDVLFNTRCLAGHLSSCAASSAGDLWMNEGLSMNAEDLAGFGLNGRAERGRVGTYLSCFLTNGTEILSSSGNTCSRFASLTSWGGDPYGNYGGVHAFLRWHLDQRAKAGGPAAVATFTKGLAGSSQGARAAVAAGSGLSFEEGYARFTTAALFSGETFDPTPATAFGAGAWSPLHPTVADPAWTKLQPGPGGASLALRTDGWQAVQTGLGSGADATVGIATSAAVRPQVAVVRFKGALATPANTAH
jgi:hypothetical protein